jgi:MazG family protein
MGARKTKHGKPKGNARTRRKRGAAPGLKPQSVGGAFDKLVAVMSRLRAPDGCPWDREQTHATLRTYLIEEAYEVLDALDGADDAKFAEELGDLLLQVLFHAQIAREEGRFAIGDVIREIYEKMIRRHPHVFGEKRAKDAAEVLRNWEQIKKQEREAKEVKEFEEGKEVKEVKEVKDIKEESASLLDGVPRTLPALVEAFQLTRKAARIGFDWYDLEGIFAKLDEESHELRQALVRKPHGSAPATSKASARAWQAVEGEIGDILFVAVNLARFLEIDPEIALKKTSAKFARRFREMERVAREQGTTLAEVPRLQMEKLWDQAKLNETRNS